MFCPRCGTENASEQGFCRQCGLSLPAVGLALEGRVDEAVGRLKAGAGSLSGGAVILVIGLLNALVNGYFAAWQSAVFSALLGSAVGVPLMAVGLARVGRARRLLNPNEGLRSLPGAGKDVGEPHLGAHASALGRRQAAQAAQTARGSVAEHTTLKLGPSESKNGK